MGSTSTTGGVSGIVGEIIMGDDDGGAGAYLEDDMVARAAAVQALEDERMTNAGAVCDAVGVMGLMGRIDRSVGWFGGWEEWVRWDGNYG